MKRIFFTLTATLMMSFSFAQTFNLYINNLTGWEEVALYAWADGRNDILGAWPGIQAESTIEKDGNTYLVFTIEESVLPAKFIFNNNNKGQQTADFLVSEARDMYLTATATALVEEGTPVPTYSNFLYIEDQTGWDALFVYAYDNNGRTTILGGWPGKAADKEETIDDVTYKAYGIPADFAPAFIILNNNAGTQLTDYSIEETRDYYLVATTLGVSVKGEETQKETYHIYVNNLTDWAEFDLYAWGTYEAFGDWPGAVTSNTQTLNNITYNVYDFQVAEGGNIELNLIFHNNVGENVEGDLRQFFTINQPRDYYLNVSNDGVTEGQTTGINTTVKEASVQKQLINGQLILQKGGKHFNVFGTELK